VKLRYTRTALTQLDTIFTHIADHNPTAASRVLARIHRAIRRLVHFPLSARATDRAGMRVLTVPGFPYVVFYTVNTAAQEVRILRVLHARQDRE